MNVHAAGRQLPAAGRCARIDPRGSAAWTPSRSELATGLLHGSVPQPWPNTGESPRQALETLLARALASAPCVIGFSGGRDSSALLAAAVGVARREGLPLPVPATLEFADPATDERTWQEQLLRHLGVDDWVHLRFDDELDIVGPLAGAGLHRHGVLYPANAHLIVPMAQAARGGVVLTGVGGDDVFGAWPWWDLGELAARRRRPRLGDSRRIAHLLAPRGVRAEIRIRRESWLSLPWLPPAVRRPTALALAREISGAPAAWNARMRWAAQWRSWRGAVHSMALHGADHGARVEAPFLDPRYLSALARAGGRTGWGDRTATMRALFGGLLPEAFITRRTKAEFSAPLFGAHTKRFAASWDGAGLDPEWFDAAVLRRIWATPQPHSLSGLALQAAWLHAETQGISAASAPTP